MARKRFTTEQIISKLREAEVALAQGQSVKWVCFSTLHKLQIKNLQIGSKLHREKS